MAKPQCAHGERTFREGDGPKGHWQAWFCPTPKGTPDQCSPEWVKKGKAAYNAPAPQAVPVAPATDYSAVLERIAVALEMIANKDLKEIPF